MKKQMTLEWLEKRGPVTLDELRAWAKMSQEVFDCYTHKQIVELMQQYCQELYEKTEAPLKE